MHDGKQLGGAWQATNPIRSRLIGSSSPSCLLQNLRGLELEMRFSFTPQIHRELNSITLTDAEKHSECVCDGMKCNMCVCEVACDYANEDAIRSATHLFPPTALCVSIFLNTHIAWTHVETHTQLAYMYTHMPTHSCTHTGRDPACV